MFGQKDMHIQGAQINQFNNVATQPIPRSTFIRSFPSRTTFDPNWLIPIFNDEVLPGDEINIKLDALVRLSTPIKPIMDNLYFETFWFFVPNRLVWENWEKFQGQQASPGDSVDYTIPVLNKNAAPMNTTGFQNQSLHDYLGIATRVTGLEDISALYGRAYDLIWNEWFRDQNLNGSKSIPLGNGPDDPALQTLQKRNKRKDYYTSGLPWPQKGPAVSIGLTGTAPVLGIGTVFNAGWGDGGGVNFRYSDGTQVTRSTGQFASDLGNVIVDQDASTGYPNVRADLSGASAITINALRQASRYQQILELDARAGTRYVESLYSRFGVVSPDFRLQRPELIGQGQSRINVYAIPQTSPTTGGSTPQGNLSAFGTGQIQGNHGCRYSATEHGMIFGLANVRADLTYQQGVPRRFTRQQRLDFYEPLLNGLGEQAILNRELVAAGTANDKNAFAYAERFSEYRFYNPMITGKFRSNDPQTLDIWHLSQFFGGTPGLNDSFILENVPISRVVAVPSEPSFLFDGFFNYVHVRPMPIRSNPGISRL